MRPANPMNCASNSAANRPRRRQPGAGHKACGVGNVMKIQCTLPRALDQKIVAQISNLLYRRFSIGIVPEMPPTSGRLETCDTAQRGEAATETERGHSCPPR